MPNRSFVDSQGVRWRVWSTVPTGNVVLGGTYAAGWLTFENDQGLIRRLTPIPDGWESAADDRLCLLCGAAAEMPRHTGPIQRMVRDTPPSAPQPDAAPPA
jgi:hypothetical protein